MTSSDEKKSFLDFLTQPRNLLFIILVISFFMRFVGLGEKSLWVDEIIASYVATGPDLTPTNDDFSYIYWQRYFDVSPPLRDYIAHFSFRLFGVNEAALRLFPAIFGVLGIWLIFHVTRKWFNEKIALWAALLLALSPFHLHHSQDGRMYTIFIFFSLIGLYNLYQAYYSDRKKWMYWTGFVIWNTLNIYLTYFGFFALITQLVIGFTWILMDSRSSASRLKYIFQNTGKLFITLSFIANLYIPWIHPIWQFVLKHTKAPIPYQIPFLPLNISKETAQEYVYHLKPDLGFLYRLLADFSIHGIGFYIYLFFFLLGLPTLFKLNKKIGIALILWLIVPLVITFAPPSKELFFNRYISYMMTGYLIIIAVGIWKMIELLHSTIKNVLPIQKIIITSLIILFCFLLNIQEIYSYYKFEKQNWKQAVDYMIPKLQTGDIIITGPYNAFWCMLYYMKQNGAKHSPVTKGKYDSEGCQVYLPGKTVGLISKLNTSTELLAYRLDFPRLWYVSAYYRSYQYRNPDYFDYIEREFNKPEILSAKTPDNQIYIFYHSDPNIKPNPAIKWVVW